MGRKKGRTREKQQQQQLLSQPQQEPQQLQQQLSQPQSEPQQQLRQSQQQLSQPRQEPQQSLRQLQQLLSQPQQELQQLLQSQPEPQQQLRQLQQQLSQPQEPQQSQQQLRQSQQQLPPVPQLSQQLWQQPIRSQPSHQKLHTHQYPYSQQQQQQQQQQEWSKHLVQEHQRKQAPLILGKQRQHPKNHAAAMQAQQPIERKYVFQEMPLNSEKTTRPQMQKNEEVIRNKQEIEGTISTKGAKDSLGREYGLKIPQRKNLKSGTVGRHTRIETNHFSLDLSGAKQDMIVHYDVAINPDRPKRLFRTVMESFRQENYPKQFPAFDGKKNLYSCGYLPFKENIVGSVVINDDEQAKPKEYSVQIQYANILDIKKLIEYMESGCSLHAPRDVMQAVDVILREASARNFIQVGRSFFRPGASLDTGDLGDGLVLHSGFFQSASFGCKSFVNIDVIHKVFAKVQNVVALMAEMANTDHRQLTTLTEWVKKNVDEYLRSLKVYYELPNQPGSKRCVRVNGLVGSSRSTTFQLDSGSSITVLKYFEKEKQIRLQFPDLPCLHVGPPNRNIYVPAELCTVKSQLVIRPLTDRQANQMPRMAATNTDVRKRKILDAVDQTGFKNSSTLQEFGFSVNRQLEKVDARVLDAPCLEYKRDVHVRPKFGTWRASQYLAGSQLRCWGVLNIAGSRSVPENKIRYFVEILLKAAQNVEMQISPPLAPYTIDCMPENRVKEMEKFFKNSTKNLELLVVIIPDKPDLYHKVKQIAELEVGVLTQCIKASTIIKAMNIATVANILHKLNAKRNGVNHSLLSKVMPSCLEEAVMLVGADVTHPPARVDDFPSIAAVCASHDPKIICYNTQCRFQEPRKEIIVDLKNIMVEHLNFFKNNRRNLPEKIIFYRDGVGEGQFLQVLSYELRAIQAACGAVATGYKPKITFLVVQKRHHTRFFPLSKQDTEGKNNNVLPGTVVDTKITHPTETDFYLVSHASIQGVSRPTRYHKLWDDSDISEDELQSMTYYLCHMFSRCTRSVSYPAPTYYAHLAAYRVRAHIKGQCIQIKNLAMEQKRRKILDDICRKYPMFFV